MFLHFDLDSTKVCVLGLNWQYVCIGSGVGVSTMGGKLQPEPMMTQVNDGYMHPQASMS